MENDKIMIKLSYNNRKHNCGVIKTYEELRYKASECFKELKSKSFEFQYIDSENEYIELMSQDEFEAAECCTGKFLNIFVVNVTDNVKKEDQVEDIEEKKDISTKQIQTNIIDKEIMYDGLITDCEKEYSGYPGSLVEICLNVENTGNRDWPDDASLYCISDEPPVMIENIGAVKVRNHRKFYKPVRLPMKFNDEYVMKLQLREKNVNIGSSIDVKIKIHPLITEINVDTKEIEENIVKFKLEEIKQNFKVDPKFDMNLERLLKSFTKCVPSDIYSVLCDNSNNLNKSVNILYKISKEVDS